MRTQRYRGPECLAGLPGSGKSYWLVRYGVAALREGVRVFTNAGFEIVDHEKGCLVEWRRIAAECERVGEHPPAQSDCRCARRSERYFSLEELLTVPNQCVILLDEAPVFVNSRKSQEFPRGLLYRLTQVRKDGLRFYYSAIDEMMVDANLRRVTFWTWHCQAWPFGFFRRKRYAPIDRRKSDDKPINRQWFRVQSKIADCYDTLSKVWIPPEVVESLLEDRVRGWVPLTDELVEALWAGGRDQERARALLAHYQRAGQELAERSFQDADGAAKGPQGAVQAPGGSVGSIEHSNGDSPSRGRSLVVDGLDLLPAYRRRETASVSSDSQRGDSTEAGIIGAHVWTGLGAGHHSR